MKFDYFYGGHVATDDLGIPKSRRGARLGFGLASLGRMPTLTEAQIAATYDGALAAQAGLPTVRDLVRDGAWLTEIQAQLPYWCRSAGRPIGGDPANHRVVWPRRVATI